MRAASPWGLERRGIGVGSHLGIPLRQICEVRQEHEGTLASLKAVHT